MAQSGRGKRAVLATSVGSGQVGREVLGALTIYRKDASGRFVPFEETPFPDLERVLEDWIESNPHVLLDGEQIAIIGRQPRSGFGKYLDLLGIDASGACVVIELKRGETPRDVVAQTLEYAAWVDSLSLSDLDDIAREYAERRGIEAESVTDVYQNRFGSEGEEEEENEDEAQRITFNTRQRMIIVAERFSREVEQSLRYLRTKLGVDASGVRFSIHQAGGETLLETQVVVGRERLEAAAAKAPARRGPEPDETIAQRVETEFLRKAVTGFEEWVQAQPTSQMEVRHRARSDHSLHHGGQRILSWYFAKRWMSFYLPHPTPEEEGLLRSKLSEPESIRPAGSRITFHVSTDGDLEVVKRIVLGRTTMSSNHPRVEG